MINAADYTISIRKANFEGEVCFEARVKELPDVAEYGDTYSEAYELAIDTIETTAEALPAVGKRMPEPAQITEDYSGRVTLRLPKSLHRGLAEKAEDEGVSLNQLIVTVLGAYRGFDGAMAHVQSQWGEINQPKRHYGTRPTLRVVSQRPLQKASGY